MFVLDEQKIRLHSKTPCSLKQLYSLRNFLKIIMIRKLKHYRFLDYRNYHLQIISNPPLVPIQRTSAGHHVYFSLHLLENGIVLFEGCELFRGLLALGRDGIKMFGS